VRFRGIVIPTAIAALTLAACGSDSESSVPSTPEAEAFTDRLVELDDIVEIWSDADSIETAQVAAEAATNLIVGPGGPGYGDRNGDGTIEAETARGVLRGSDGTPDGLADDLSANECIERDVLGGSWDDPSARWGEMTDAIDAWQPDANTMPTLASHPMRVVGWATFALDADSVEDAREYAGHAGIHVRISANALTC